MSNLVEEFRIAIRSLWRDRSATLLAVVVLGLGLAGTSVFYAIVNAAVLRGLGIPDSDRVLFIASRNAQGRPAGISLREFDDLARAASRLSGVAAYVSTPMVIGEAGTAPARLFGTYISAGGFPLLRSVPTLGRTMSATDDREGAPVVAFIGSDVWKSRYGADPNVIGRSITINGRAATIAGVMPAGFKFPTRTDVWVPLRAWPEIAPPRRDAVPPQRRGAVPDARSQNPAARSLSVLARVADEVSVAAGRAELEALTKRWSANSPAEYRGITFTSAGVDEALLGRVTDRTWMGFLTVGTLVLVIACANVATLLLLRGVRRERDIAVRAALGATRTRIVCHLTLESIAIAAIASALGLALACSALRALSATMPAEGLPYWFRFTIDWRVVGMLGALSLGSVLVAGLTPAIHLSSVSGDSLRGSRHTGGQRTRRWIGVLVAAEVALTLALVAAVGSAIRNTQAALRQEVSIDPAPLLTFSLTLPPATYDTPDKRFAFIESLQTRVETLPSVVSASATTALPRSGGAVRDLEQFDRPSPPGATKPTVVAVGVDERYFDVLDTRVLRGRSFSAIDGTPGHETAIVNQRFAEMYSSGADPIGHRIRLGPAPPGAATTAWLTIVGVAPTIRQRLNGVTPDPVVYVPLRAAAPVTSAIVIRTSTEPAAITSAVREQLRQLDPTVPADRPMSLEQAFSDVEWTTRTSDRLLDGIGVTALLLALVGLYAVVAHSVVERRREFGVRLALGATPRAIARHVLQRGVRYVLVATPVGLVLTWWLDQLISDPAGSQHLTDAAIIGPVVGFVLVCAVVACLAPARHAMRADPVVALRAE